MVGLALWLVTGLIAKAIYLPVYRKIASLDVGDMADLDEERNRLNSGCILQASLTVVAAALMTIVLVQW